MRRKLTAVDRLMSETIAYGGIAMTRAQVYRQALVDTGSTRAADMFAFAKKTCADPSRLIPFERAVSAGLLKDE